MSDWEDVGSADWEDVTPAKKKVSLADIFPSKQETEDVLSSIQGLGEAGANLITGAIGGGIGAATGAIAGMRNAGVGSREAAKKVEQEAAAQAGELTFEPRTEKGQGYAGKVGQLMQEALPIMHMAPVLEGAHGAYAAGKAMKPSKAAITAGAADEMLAKVGGEKGWEDIGTTKPISIDEAIQANEAQQPTMSQVQPDLVSPYNAVREKAMANRQMELDLGGPEVIQVPGQGLGFETTRENALARPPEEALAAQRRAEQPAPQAGQGDLFFNEEVNGPVATPYNAAERGALPEGLTENPALARRQMELQLGEQEPIHVSTEGEATRGLPEQRSLIQETDDIIAQHQAIAEARTRELQAKQAVERGETGNLFADYTNQHRPFELFRDENGQPLSRRAFEETIDNLVNEPRSVYPRPEDMDAAYAKYRENFEGKQAGLFDQPTTAKEMADVMKKEATDRIVDRHPLVLAAEKWLNTQQQFLDQLKQQGSNAAMIKDAAKDVEAAQRRLDKTKENVREGLSTGRKPSPLRRRQSGAVDPTLITGGLNKLIDAWRNKKAETSVGENQRNVLKDIPGVAGKIADYLPEQRSMEDIRAEAATRPDVEQNWAQRVSNNLTAGGLYQSLKTNNIVVKKTFETVSKAYDAANKNIRAFIQDSKDGLAPAIRDLDSKDLGQIWAKMMMHEGEKALTPQELRVAGFNDKQIHAYEAARRMDDAAFDAINQSRADAGKGPIDRRLGHVAGVFAGDFKRSFYATIDGEKVRVAVIGDNTRWGLDRMAKKIQELHPEWELGEEHPIMRSRNVGERQKAFEQALEMLSQEDPNIRSLVQTYQETMTKDAYNYLNQKKHTLQKRGVLGSEGNKEVQTIEKNAVEGMKAQIKYAENAFRWAEMSKAANELKPLLSDEKINMPNAKSWANNYLDRALGINNSRIARGLDEVIAGVAEKSPIGPTAIHNFMGFTKNVSSKVLLGFGNLGFLATNLIQPFVGLPAMRQLLSSRGLDVNMFRAALDANKLVFKRMRGEDLTGFDKQIVDFANDHGLFQNEIFDHTAQIRKNVPYYVNKVAEFGIGHVEEATRSTTFVTLAHMLRDAGIKPEEGLFEAAHKMTNQIMTDYRAIEMPKVYQDLGPVGHMAANLARFKHNQLSSLSMYAREIKNNKSYAPFGVALASSLAASGLLGLTGFQEADQIYQMVTKTTGKPDTLTRMVLDNVENPLLTHGVVSAMTGIDFSSRLGMQDVIPNSIGEAMFPGGSKLVDMAKATGNAIMNPSKTNAERAAVAVAPGSVRGALERKFFETPEGLAVNPKEGQLAGTVQRNATDKFAKSFGMTGLHESKQKAHLYQESLVDKALTDKRTSTVNSIMDDLYQIPKGDEAMKEYFHNGKGKEKLQKYLDNEGDADALVKAVEKFRTGQVTTALQRKMLSVATGKNPKQAQRYQQMKERME